MVRPRPAPEPDRYSPCARCQQAYKPVAHWPDGTVCQYCYLAAKRTRGTCPACGHDGVLPGRDSDSRPTCRPCSGVTLNVDCQECGREDELHSGGRCWACTLRRHVETLLTAPAGSVPPQLRPLADVIATMPRPNSGVTWLRAAPVRALLRGLADGSIAMTHQALDELPASRTVEYIRGLLVQQHALPSRDRRVADFERWLQALLAKQTDDEQRQLLDRYGRWHHLRRLRALSAKSPVSESAFQRAKQCLTVSTQFLDWLAAAGIPLTELAQAHIDQWYADGNSTAVHVETFLYWAIKQRLLPPHLVVPRRSDNAAQPLDEQQRLDALRRILLEDQEPLQIRVIAGLILLFAQPINRLTRLTVHDVDIAATSVRIRLAREWVEVPELFAALLARHVACRPNRQTAANATTDWLFPGAMPNAPLKPAYVSDALVRIGVPALSTRAGTWRQLVRQVPPAVLAQMLGTSSTTAMRHADLAGADYARYAPAVRGQQPSS